MAHTLIRSSKVIKSTTSAIRAHLDAVDRARELYLEKIKRAEAEYFERIKRATEIVTSEDASVEPAPQEPQSATTAA